MLENSYQWTMVKRTTPTHQGNMPMMREMRVKVRKTTTIAGRTTATERRKTAKARKTTTIVGRTTATERRKTAEAKRTLMVTRRIGVAATSHTPLTMHIPMIMIVII